ncbi:glycosyltransferase family 9 protein [Zunongwangia sp. F363]|uniref:Glycosyltransferase family 9 protein n=1 Tax=Autumnicola tepida TaxID=3075595 RepID=A0ABU3CC12_9FLAO|nr:glycosyltransferase family 9 protein [Zunongwangia sp. F363]MDT0643880.1 glycosyltransferase family 9 protein [Zunongwangia sp. F363]
MKLLVIQQKMIGDVLTSSILFEALRKKFPEAELHYLIQPHTLPVVQNNPFIDKFILYNPKLNKNPVKFLQFVNRIRQENYTDVIDVYSKISTGIISLFSGAISRLSYQKNYTSHFYTQTFQHIKNPATCAGLAIENRMQFLQALHKDFPMHARPKIYLNQFQKEKAANHLEEGGICHKNSLIMCGIVGSSGNKSYPPAYMAKILDTVVKQVKDGQILLNYSPSQEKEALAIYDLCSAGTRSKIFLKLYASELKDFIANCANCDIFIGNEGGAANIAKALTIPTFSIHSPSIKKNYWGIYCNDKDKVSVHLEDYKPELFQNKKEKEIRAKNRKFYKLFKPELIEPKLESFLKNLDL